MYYLGPQDVKPDREAPILGGAYILITAQIKTKYACRNPFLYPVSIQHLLCTRHCASALESQQYTSFCPQQVGRLAGKTNMPADDQQIIFKYCKKKKEVEPG